MEPAGIEPAFHPCEGRVLPLDYGPKINFNLKITQKDLEVQI